MALLDDIQAAIAKAKANPYSTANGSNTVKSIDSSYNANEGDALNQLLQKYGAGITGYQNQRSGIATNYQPLYDQLNQSKADTTSSYNTQIGNAKTENQDVLNQNAVDEQKNLRNILETQANNGNLMSGQTPILQLQANTARQNNDTKVYNQRAQDVNNLQTALNSKLSSIASQIQDYQKQQAEKEAEIDNTVNNYTNQGESDLASLLSDYASKHAAAVQQQQASEQAAAADAAEKQYEAQLAANAKIQAAIIAHSGSGSSSSGQTPEEKAHAQHLVGVKQVYNALSQVSKNYTDQTGDSATTTDKSGNTVYEAPVQKQMLKVLNSYYNRGGFLTEQDYEEILNHYGL